MPILIFWPGIQGIVHYLTAKLEMKTSYVMGLDAQIPYI
jgi:hypothetical protein